MSFHFTFHCYVIVSLPREYGPAGSYAAVRLLDTGVKFIPVR